MKIDHTIDPLDELLKCFGLRQFEWNFPSVTRTAQRQPIKQRVSRNRAVPTVTIPIK
jgi:hypothetical protein